jgi:Fe2+ transport system protein FeoA
MKIGGKGVILEVTPSHISTKLLELGFISGSEIEVVFKAPLKDPIAVDLNGSMISLRLEEASTILIEEKFLS